MNTSVMKQTTAESLAGTMTFPEVVGKLLTEGVESYHADLVKLEKTFYMPDGETFVQELKYQPPMIGNDFSASGVVLAIRSVQVERWHLTRVVMDCSDHYCRLSLTIARRLDCASGRIG